MAVSRLELLDQELYWRQSVDSPEFFAEQFCYIKHPQQGAIKIPLRAEQRKVLRIWHSGGNTVSLKARQIGWSTIVCVYVVWLAISRESSTIVLLSKKQDDARDLIAKCKYIYDRLPPWMTEKVARENRSVDKMVFSNDSVIEALPSKKDPARGKSTSFIVLDEWAFYEDPENAWASIEPTIDVGGQCAALSTANGAGNFFHRFYMAAKKGTNKFVPLFFSWRVVPERDDEWYESQKLKLPPWQLAQEYPDNDEMAFVASGAPAFDVKGLLAVQPEEYQQGWLSESGDGIEFGEHPGGMVYVLEHPVPGGSYVIGADVAEGRATGDFSCAQVVEVGTGRQVARWHGHMAVDLYADELYRLGQYYNFALLAPERNSVGSGLLRMLHGRLQYPNLYRERKVSSRREEVTDELGWQTNTHSKARLVTGLMEGLRDGSLQPTHEGTLSELIAYRQKVNGGWEGDPHDDEVMALGIAWQVLPLAIPSSFSARASRETNSWSWDAIAAELDKENGMGRGRPRIGAL